MRWGQQGRGGDHRVGSLGVEARTERAGSAMAERVAATTSDAGQRWRWRVASKIKAKPSSQALSSGSHGGHGLRSSTFKMLQSLALAACDHLQARRSRSNPQAKLQARVVMAATSLKLGHGGLRPHTSFKGRGQTRLLPTKLGHGGLLLI
ncbi:hypothetical protein NL676_038843 [Syzygium grande]|nr:hypothetical protein NL676_038843 [Syzygium grande]